MAAIEGIVHVCERVEFDLGEVHRCFDVIRAESFVAGLHAAYKRDPSALGPNTRANYEMGAKMSLADSAWAQSEQTRIFQRFQSAFSKYDVILSPTTPVSPFPWTELFASSVEGRPQENYYRWLALTYVVTLTTHPALSLPCGLDEAGMPFGLQIVGPFRGDSQTLAISYAFEQAFADSSTLRRPRPDLLQLREANPSLKSLVTSPPILNPSGSGTSGLSMV